ncbi:MAG: transketolase [Candidatus Ancillula sp.]|jgi:transketolase|nr:transketolase [Candidatus Ancillula sp.]
MANFEWNELDDRAVATAKILAADAVEKVGNGHPGSAISLAGAAYVLYQKVMNIDPTNNAFRFRDRFVLSAGHESILQYCQLYLGGFGLELDDIKSLRTFGSKTPGHPEYADVPGVEITTGPLGQGIASAVGMAAAARFEKGLFDPADETGVFENYTYVVCGDGCLQEGVSYEAGAFAGVQQLSNLIVIWDDNKITIEGDPKIATNEDVLKRFEAQGWDVQSVEWRKRSAKTIEEAVDTYQEDYEGLYNAIEAAKQTNRPSIIRLSTLIAYPSLKVNQEASHGSKLGAEVVADMKKKLGFDPHKSFEVAPEVIEHTRQLQKRGSAFSQEVSATLAEYFAKNPEKKALFDRMYNQGTDPRGVQPKTKLGALPEGLATVIDEIAHSFPIGESIATRAASGQIINKIAEIMPEFWGGSADLAGSNNTTIKGAESFGVTEQSTENWSNSPFGRVLHFGIREHAMGQIINGIVLYGNTRAFGGTFFQFADYMRDSARIAALQGIPSVFVWSHDSIAVGEDGPTHQPVEHLAAMRAIPNFNVVRPADAAETAFCWKKILETQDAPSGLILTRQNVPNLPHMEDSFACAGNSGKGAYVLKDCCVENNAPDVILIATGSEVQLAVEAQKVLCEQGVKSRVVSAPCLEWFEKQSDEYKESVLPKAVDARVTVEVGIAMPWYKYLGSRGVAVSLEHFGASGAEKVLFEKFGITVDAVVAAAKESMNK